MRGVEILIKVHKDDGTTDVLSRWAHPDAKGHWTSADNLGKDHQEHSGAEATCAAMAGWLRSAANHVAEAHVVAPAKAPPAAPVEASSEGLEDLL